MTGTSTASRTDLASGSSAPGVCGVCPSVMPIATIGSAYAVTCTASSPASTAARHDDERVVERLPPDRGGARRRRCGPTPGTTGRPRRARRGSPRRSSRARPLASPPHRSVRRLVAGERNASSRYPWPAWSSTPSKPASHGAARGSGEVVDRRRRGRRRSRLAYESRERRRGERRHHARRLVGREHRRELVGWRRPLARRHQQRSPLGDVEEACGPSWTSWAAIAAPWACTASTRRRKPGTNLVVADRRPAGRRTTPTG